MPCTEAQVTVTEQAKPNAGTDGTLTVCEGHNSDLFDQLGVHLILQEHGLMLTMFILTQYQLRVHVQKQPLPQ